MTPSSVDTRSTVDCTLVVNIGPRDFEMALTTIPHMIRSHKVAFARTLLVIDRTPPSGRIAGPSAKMNADTFTQAIGDATPGSTIQMLGRELVTRRRINNEWFGRSDVTDRCASGTPIYPFVFGIDGAATEFILHADCDMLFHDPGNPSWIEEGMRILETEPDIIFVNQMMGPRSDSVSEPEFLAPFDLGRQLRLAKTFSTRCFLLQRKKLRHFLPLQSVTYPLHRRILYGIQQRSPFLPLERMVANQLALTGTFRCDLTASYGFTVHAGDKSWFSGNSEHIETVIREIEVGRYARSQIGHINLTDSSGPCGLTP